MIKKIRKKFKKVNSQKGFTLLEILVVLTIMGFLIAMVAPRLAGIGNSAVDTICDTNQNRMMTYLSTYFQQTDGSLPNNLTNLVSQDGTGASAKYAIPSVSNDDPDDGAEALSSEFDDRNHFVIHHLNAAEVAELADLGIENVFNLNEYALTPGTLMASMDPEPLAIGVGVAMTGIGAPDTADAPAFVLTHPGEKEWGEPKWFARIVFGLGPECDLITSGIIINAAHCPGGLRQLLTGY
jgi:prepilin-type N-terminal cleavage/methylation domain-containing protein